VPVETGGASVSARIFVLSGISATEAQDILWRRETRRKGNYCAPAHPGLNDVVIEALENFHGLDIVYYTRIKMNIEGLCAEKLAELAISSAKAVRRGALYEGKDGITYLIAAKENGILTPLMSAYEQRIKNMTGSQNLADARKKLTGC
jgi:hypothetical protein